MQFTDMELALVEHALRCQASDHGFAAVAFRKEAENDAAEVALARARNCRELADKIANRF